MVAARQATGPRHAATPTTSSIQPTGWIRSNSASKPASTVGVLGDRTNLRSNSRTTPSTKTPVAQWKTNRTVNSGTTSAKHAAKQHKLSTFFAPNTAPPASALTGPRPASGVYYHSPSVQRAQRCISSKSNTKSTPSALADLQDQELDARASTLLKGRFGSVSRSLTPSRTSTPTLAPPLHSPPRSDPELPQRLPHISTRPPPLRTVTTPPRPQPLLTHVHDQDQNQQQQQQQQQLSSPPFEPTLMHETLSNFTPPAWEKAKGSKMALFQRLAGVPKAQILEHERSKMAEELEQAHRRMQAGSSRSPVQSRRPTRKNALQTKSGTGAKSDRVVLGIAAAAERSSPMRPKAILRSPRTNRRIYALETQLLGERAQSVQPTRMASEEVDAGQRRAVSEARRDAETIEEESETLPLSWPVEEQDATADPTCGEGEQTQPLPWNDDDGDGVVPVSNSLPRSPQAVTEVPPSDDEDLLLEPVILSCSSSPRLTSPSPSPSSSAKKRRRVQVSPTLGSNNQRLAKVSPISLTPTAGASCRNRFDRVVSALRKEERRQHNGMQLNLNSFLSSSLKRETNDEEIEMRRSGLSEDLEDVLSDDEPEEEVGDRTVMRNVSCLQQGAGQKEEEETQPLAWNSSPTRPTARPVQNQSEDWLASSPATQRTTSSTSTSTSTGSRSSISLPSDTGLHDAGHTQLLSFFEQL